MITSLNPKSTLSWSNRVIAPWDMASILGIVAAELENAAAAAGNCFWAGAVCYLHLPLYQSASLRRGTADWGQAGALGKSFCFSSPR